MNSKQRRKAYRAMPKPGTTFRFRNSRDDRVKTAISFGPVLLKDQAEAGYSRNNVVNALRVRAQYLRDDGAVGMMCAPLVSRIIRG